MKKDDMIKYLIEEGEFTEKKLKKMKVNDVQKLFDERFDIEEDDDFSKGLEFGEDYVDDPTIESVLVGKTVTIDVAEEDIKIIEEEIIEIDISKLSTVERRAYARTGILPQITINRYTRFDDEDPKMEI